MLQFCTRCAVQCYARCVLIFTPRFNAICKSFPCFPNIHTHALSLFLGQKSKQRQKIPGINAEEASYVVFRKCLLYLTNCVAYFTSKRATCNTLQSAEQATHCGSRLPLLSATQLSSNWRHSSLSGFTFAVYFRIRIFTNLNETKTSFCHSAKNPLKERKKRKQFERKRKRKISKEFRRIKSRHYTLYKSFIYMNLSGETINKKSSQYNISIGSISRTFSLHFSKKNLHLRLILINRNSKEGKTKRERKRPTGGRMCLHVLVLFRLL